MKTLNEIRNALATANQELFTSPEVSEIIGMSYKTLIQYVSRHKELYPSIRTETRNGELLWTKDEIIRLVEYRTKYFHKATPVPITPITATSELPAAEYISPIDVLIQIDKTISEDPNVKAYYDMRNRFDNMNETALQKLFKPLLERFKFSYICKCVPEIQSQMLTCINKGRLRGMDKYGMDFNAFLKLVKFAHDNCCPLDAVDDQKEVN